VRLVNGGDAVHVAVAVNETLNDHVNDHVDDHATKRFGTLTLSAPSAIDAYERRSHRTSHTRSGEREAGVKPAQPPLL